MFEVSGPAAKEDIQIESVRTTKHFLTKPYLPKDKPSKPSCQPNRSTVLLGCSSDLPKTYCHGKLELFIHIIVLLQEASPQPIELHLSIKNCWTVPCCIPSIQPNCEGPYGHYYYRGKRLAKKRNSNQHNQNRNRTKVGQHLKLPDQKNIEIIPDQKTNLPIQS